MTNSVLANTLPSIYDVNKMIETKRSATTEFKDRVYQVVSTIPCGEVRSYKWVAEKIGHPKAARAVGQVLNRNPDPFVVPCHRVVMSDGRSGGYRFGTRLKEQLLKAEKECRKVCP